MARGERLKRMLMVCFAAVLFVLGVWLLIRPVQSRDADLHSNCQCLPFRSQRANSASCEPCRSLLTAKLIDNVVANNACRVAASCPKAAEV
jgi:hypothetical protein